LLSEVQHFNMRKFKVNSYITLKLEDNKTEVYIAGEKFIQCKHLLLNIPYRGFYHDLTNIESIDEAEERLKAVRNNPKENIVMVVPKPEGEFWGHCSNLQVWTENNYNTQVLHRNIAFPLLRKLVEVGDPKAKLVFREEICKRLEEGNVSVINYLKEEQYLEYLDHEQIVFSLLEAKEAVFIAHMEDIINKEIKILFDWEDPVSSVPTLTFADRHVTSLTLDNCQIRTLPKSIQNLRNLNFLHLDLRDSQIGLLDVVIKELPFLKQFNLTLYLENPLETSFRVLERVPSLKYLTIRGHTENFKKLMFKNLKKKGVKISTY